MAQVVAAVNDESEEEIVVDHDLERQTLIGQVQSRVQKPGCKNMGCKAFVLSLSGILFLLMMIQLWTDYGEYIQTQTFPPKLATMGSYCKNGTRQDLYKPLVCKYDFQLICAFEKPSKVFVQSVPRSEITWESGSLILDPYSVSECIDLIVCSI